MKKIIIFGFIFMLVGISIVFAGNKLQLDLIDNDQQLVVLGIDDAAVFDFPVRKYDINAILNDETSVTYEVANEEQVVMLREVDSEMNLARITVFIEGAEVPQYVTLDPTSSLRLDFERDEVDDLIIRIVDFYEEGATILLEKNLEGGKPNLRFYKRLYGRGESDSKYMEIIKDNIIYALAVVLILILISRTRFVRKKYRKVKRRFRS